jgi:predicted regulator of Ras-like GTPase activity (Roadblock/LC7/MglB family)
MSIDLAKVNEIAGFLGACLVDADTGLMLTSEGGGGFDLEAAAAMISGVLRAKREAFEGLGLDDPIEEAMIQLGRQIHLMRPLRDDPNVYLYVILDRRAATYGLARLQIAEIEAGISLL